MSVTMLILLIALLFMLYDIRVTVLLTIIYLLIVSGSLFLGR